MSLKVKNFLVGKYLQMMPKRFVLRFNFSSDFILLRQSFYLEIPTSSTGAFFMLSESWALKIKDWNSATKDSFFPFFLLAAFFRSIFNANLLSCVDNDWAPGFGSLAKISVLINKPNLSLLKAFEIVLLCSFSDLKFIVACSKHNKSRE